MKKDGRRRAAASRATASRRSSSLGDVDFPSSAVSRPAGRAGGERRRVDKSGGLTRATSVSSSRVHNDDAQDNDNVIVTAAVARSAHRDSWSVGRSSPKFGRGTADDGFRLDTTRLPTRWQQPPTVVVVAAIARPHCLVPIAASSSAVDLWPAHSSVCPATRLLQNCNRRRAGLSDDGGGRGLSRARPQKLKTRRAPLIEEASSSVSVLSFLVVSQLVDSKPLDAAAARRAFAFWSARNLGSNRINDISRDDRAAAISNPRAFAATTTTTTSDEGRSEDGHTQRD